MLANQIANIEVKRNNFSLIPTNFEEAMQYAKLIAESDFCPREHKGKPGNVMIAIQYGAELGLSPMQALQNISVINGRPCVWGDALLGLVMANHNFVNIHEEIKNGVAYCVLERKNKESVTRTFSIEDAKKANLWGKAGTWTQYPNRMLQMRARTFALRDLFPDVLKGLTTREEVEDYSTKQKYYSNKTHVNQIENVTEVKQLESMNETKTDEFENCIKNIKTSKDMNELKEVFKIACCLPFSKDKDLLNQLIDEKNQRKHELMQSDGVPTLSEDLLQ